MPEESGAALTAARTNARPPRDNLVRASANGLALRAVAAPADDPEASDNANGMPTLYGYFTRFNEWAEIDSIYEGHFLERIAPGAFKKTFQETTPIVLFQHGMDPSIGDKALGRAVVLEERDEGPYYEVPLLDTSYNRDLVPGLEANLYGASFRFSVLRDDYDKRPGESEHNPKGLPERTIREVRNQEFGPVSFPAYAGATAGVRSMTDEFLLARATHDPERLKPLLAYLEARDQQRQVSPPPVAALPADEPDTAPPSESAEAEPHPIGERRKQPAARPHIYGMSRKENAESWRL